MRCGCGTGTLWQTSSLVSQLVKAKLLSVDELRRGIEALPPPVFAAARCASLCPCVGAWVCVCACVSAEASGCSQSVWLCPHAPRLISYYEKWALSTSAILVERGVITRRELEEALGPAWEDTHAAAWGAGDTVRVKEEGTATRFRKVLVVF